MAYKSVYESPRSCAYSK